MVQSSYQKERTQLNKLATNVEVFFYFTRHARNEMALDNIEPVTVQRILQRGAVVRVEQNRFEETWNVEGRDHDGNLITVVAVAQSEGMTIKIITAWRRK